MARSELPARSTEPGHDFACPLKSESYNYECLLAAVMKVHILSLVEDASPLADVHAVVMCLPQLALITFDKENGVIDFSEAADKLADAEEAMQRRSEGPGLRYEMTVDVPDEVVETVIAAGREHDRAKAGFEAAADQLTREINDAQRQPGST